MLRVGIVGLPNVGKSTLFNAILGRQMALTAPYPFATVEPNVGVVDVPDERLEKLRDAMFPKDLLRPGPAAAGPGLSRPPLVFATVTFVDIAGLVKGASQGQGLGNQFLGHIREADLILHVLRDFDDRDVPRAADSKNPEHDAEIVRTELELKDLEVAERAGKKDGQDIDSRQLLKNKPVIYAINVDEKKLVEAPKESYFAPEASGLALAKGDPSGFGRSSDFSLREKSGSSEKPVIYAVNVSEDKLGADKGSALSQQGRALSDETVFYFSAKLEEEISKMPKNEQKEYLKIYGLERSCLDRIIGECFRALGLISFFTAPLSASGGGVKEVRAWPTRRDSPAPKAAGVIHSDFEKLFIRAEVIGWEKLAEAKSWTEAKEKGLVRTEGRDYIVRDGDVCNFLIGK